MTRAVRRRVACRDTHHRSVDDRQRLELALDSAGGSADKGAGARVHWAEVAPCDHSSRGPYNVDASLATPACLILTVTFSSIESSSSVYLPARATAALSCAQLVERPEERFWRGGPSLFDVVALCPVIHQLKQSVVECPLRHRISALVVAFPVFLCKRVRRDAASRN